MWPFDKDKKQSDHESFQLKKNAPKERNLDQSDTFECIADEENEKSDNVSDTISDGDDDEVILPPEPYMESLVAFLIGDFLREENLISKMVRLVRIAV